MQSWNYNLHYHSETIYSDSYIASCSLKDVLFERLFFFRSFFLLHSTAAIMKNLFELQWYEWNCYEAYNINLLKEKSLFYMSFCTCIKIHHHHSRCVLNVLSTFQCILRMSQSEVKRWFFPLKIRFSLRGNIILIRKWFNALLYVEIELNLLFSFFIHFENNIWFWPEVRKTFSFYTFLGQQLKLKWVKMMIMIKKNGSRFAKLLSLTNNQ